MNKQLVSWNWIIPLILLVSLLSGCAPQESDNDENEIEVITLQRGSLVTSITSTGSVSPAAEVVLSFEVTGRVEEVLVRAGEHVQQGQVLARLDTSDLELQVRSTEAALASAQAQLEQIKGGPRPEEVAVSEANLEAAQAALNAAIAERQRLQTDALSAEIAAAEAQVASALSQQKSAQNIHDDTMRCETITLPDGKKKEICPLLGRYEEEARYNLHASDLTLEAAQAQLESLQGNFDYQMRTAWANESRVLGQRDAAQAQLDLLKAGATEAQIAAAEASVDQAQVALDTAQLALERATLKAPFDGVISHVEIDVGEFVAPQMPGVNLVDDNLFRIEADVDEADIGWIEVGQDVQITLDAFQGRGLTGVVSAIAPSSRLDLGVVSFQVTIEISETALPLRGGMTANVEIVQEQREDVLVVPNRAIWIDSDSGRPFVEKIEEEQIVAVFIEQGISNEEMSEVLSGLQENDKLVVRSVSIRDRFRSVVTMPMTGQ